jgi:hypothetical protein
MIVTSTYTEGPPQVDGRRYVSELHTDDRGQTYTYEWLGDQDAALVLADRAAVLSAQIAAQRAAEAVVLGTALPLTKYQFRQLFTFAERVAVDELEASLEQHPGLTVGQAQGHQAVSTRHGFEMSSRKVYIKRGKRIHIFDTAEDADEWLEAEDKARQVVNVAKPKPKAKAKVFKALDEAVPHDVVRLDVVRSMVDYLGIPVEMPTLEAQQDWAEVARVALMARHMQDEEDIELLLVA